MSINNESSLRFVLFATGVTAIGGFLFGYDTAVINGANSYLKAHMNLDPAREGLAGASAILGCIPGAMFAGFLSDRFGRRKMLFFVRSCMRFRVCFRRSPAHSTNSSGRASSAGWVLVRRR
jgi:MFS family permease